MGSIVLTLVLVLVLSFLVLALLLRYANAGQSARLGVPKARPVPGGGRLGARPRVLR
ncbi:hypothetical protein LQL77_21655 [Rhodococcus cerastii]|nr:hypothetical protein [Rhodococcus cerastii]